VATLATYGRDEKYKPILRKTLGNLIGKSQGSPSKEILPDDTSMQKIREIVSVQKSEVVKTFSNVLTFLMKQLDHGNFDSGCLSRRVFIRRLDTNQEFVKLCQLGEEPEIEELESELSGMDLNMDRNTLFCSVLLEEIQGPYLIEGSVKDKASFQCDLVEKINDIRKYPWMIFEILMQEKFDESINVVMTPYCMESFLQLNQENESQQAVYSTVFKFTEISFVLLHKKSKLGKNDVQMALNLNFVWASNLFFNRSNNYKQLTVGSKFEIVYIYLTFLRDYLRTKCQEPIFLEDLEYTLEKLAVAPESLVKMPQFSIYYSLNLFKRILKESKIIDAKTDLFTSLMVRKRLNVESDLYLDEMIKFVGCLQWLQEGCYPEKFAKHKLLDHEIMKQFWKSDGKYSIPDILRILLREFFGGLELPSTNNFVLLNQIQPEREFYFNVPSNFLKYILISLNRPNLPLNDSISSSDTKNLDLNLILRYNENHSYNVVFKNLLYESVWQENSRIDVCWSTFRPRSIFPDGTWSNYCKNLDQTLEHKERLQLCDSLHLSHYKNYLSCFEESHGKIPDVPKFFSYLVKTFPYKTFPLEVLADIKDVVETVSQIMEKRFKGDPALIKEVIHKTWSLEERQEIERNCQYPDCFHCKKS
jgi:hypothetical protein